MAETCQCEACEGGVLHTLFHRAPRAKRLAGRCGSRAGIATADALPRITSNPSLQNISIVEVVSRRVCAPVSASVLVEMLVLALVWKVFVAKLFMADSVVDLSMTESSFFWPKKAPLTTPQLEGW